MWQHPTLLLCLEKGETFLDRALVFAKYLAGSAEDTDIGNEVAPAEAEDATKQRVDMLVEVRRANEALLIRSVGQLFRNCMCCRARRQTSRHHGSHGAQSLAAERGQASDELAEMSIADVLEYSLGGIEGLPQHTKANLHTLVSQVRRLLPVRGFPIDDANALQEADMDTLVDCGHVEREDGELRLAAVAVKALREDVVQHSPAEVPAVRLGVALLNMTIPELFLSLEAAGWRPQRLRGNMVELPLDIVWDAKIWYIRGGVSKWSMLMSASIASGSGPCHDLRSRKRRSRPRRGHTWMWSPSLMMMDRMCSCRFWTNYSSMIRRSHHSQHWWFTAQGAQRRHGRQTLLNSHGLLSRRVSSLARRPTATVQVAIFSE